MKAVLTFSLFAWALPLTCGFASNILATSAPSSKGMSFINNSGQTIYLDTTIVMPGVPGEQAPCPKASASNITLYASPYLADKQGYNCRYLTTLGNNQSIRQIAAIPQLSGKTTSINICSKTHSDPNHPDPQCSLAAYSLCQNDETDSSGNSIPNNPFQDQHYHIGVNIPESFAGNDTYSLTVEPNQCRFNVDLSQYSKDLLPISAPSFQVIANKVYSKTNPVLNLNNFFIDRYSIANKVPTERRYFVSVNGHQVKPQVASSNPTPIANNPLNLQYHYVTTDGSGGINITYRSALYTDSNGIPASSQDCDSTTGICTVAVCGCDPNIKADNLFAGQGGVCPSSDLSNPTGGMQSCTIPVPSGSTVSQFCSDGKIFHTGTNDTGPVGICFNIKPFTGLYALSPTQIANNDSSSQASPTLLTVPLPAAGGWVNLSQYFATTDNSTTSPDQATYAIITQTSGAIPDRNNGNAPTPTPSANSGTNWGPIILHNGRPGTPVAISNFKLATEKGGLPSDKGGNYWLYTGPEDGDNIIQITVQATLNGVSAYQTLYLNLSDKNKEANGSLRPNYTLLSRGLGAWAYSTGTDPKFMTTNAAGAPVCNTKTQASTGANCKPGAWDYPDCQFIATIKNSTQPISIITPDIGWVQFGTANHYSKFWNDQYGPLYNNLYPAKGQSLIQCLAKYYKANASNIKFLATYEFDGALKGYLADIQDRSATTDQVSRMTELVANIASGIAVDQSGNAANNIDGIQFDVEPLPTSEKAVIFFKRVADLLARQGKLNEIFAFADADSPALIMAQGPLGIFLPSTYDVGMKTDPDAFKNRDYTNFGENTADNKDTIIPNVSELPKASDLPSLCPGYPNAYNFPYASLVPHSNFLPAQCPLTQLDYACHYDTTGDTSDNFLIKSYCNINRHNTLFNNQVRFDHTQGKDIVNQFSLDNTEFGGHFQLAVPSEGSATNWTYEIIYTPRMANSSGGECDPSKGTACTVPSLPSTDVPHYVKITQDDKSCWNNGKLSLTTACMEEALTGTDLPSPLPAANNVYLYYTSDINAASSKDSTQPPCTMYSGAKNSPVFCKAAVLEANPNPEATPGQDSTTSQYHYINDIINLAQGQVTTAKQPLLGNPSDNPSNLGLAFYALATEGAYGCEPGGDHGGVPNCLEPFPIGTAAPANQAQKATDPEDVWMLAKQYIGGVTPPPTDFTIESANVIYIQSNGGMRIGVYLSKILPVGDTIQITSSQSKPITVNGDGKNEGFPVYIPSSQYGQNTLSLVVNNSNGQPISPVKRFTYPYTKITSINTLSKGSNQAKIGIYLATPITTSEHIEVKGPNGTKVNKYGSGINSYPVSIANLHSGENTITATVYNTKGHPMSAPVTYVISIP